MSTSQPEMRAIHLLRKLDPNEWGGTETAVQRLFDGLRQQGVSPVVYCPRVPHHPGSDPLENDGFAVRRFRAFVPALGLSTVRRRQLVAVGGNLMSFDLIPALLREGAIDLIHTHALGRLGGIGRVVAKQRQVPFVVSIHGGVLDLPSKLKESFNSAGSDGWEWGRVFGFLLKSHRLFHDADAIVVCNSREAELLRKQHPDKRVAIQPHGVPIEIFRQDCRRTAIAAFPQIQGRPVLLCLGRVDPVKNQEWLVEQLPGLKSVFPELLLILAGPSTDEVYEQRIKNKIAVMGLSGNVLLTGGLPPNDPRLIGLMQTAAVVTLSSISETFGLVLLEAWAAGTVVLSSRTSGASALVRHGINGWLFDLEKPEVFHQHCIQALSEPTRRMVMAEVGRKLVEEEYSVLATAGRMKRLYEDLIAERKRHALRHHQR